MNTLYEMIFKRKSFHVFKDYGLTINNDELEDIKNFINNLNYLSDISVEIDIVKEEETTCKRHAEYCICFYSEVKENYLMNIGYIGEQIDLYLASLNIGALWFGIGKVDKFIEGKEYVIMMGIKKVPEDSFRKDMFKSKRKSLEEIWKGELLPWSNIVRFAPSACNTQPWIIEHNGNHLDVYRYKKEGKRGIMPVNKVIYYNQIDMGILLCFIEMCLKHDEIGFKRELYSDDKSNLCKVATYEI